MSKKHLTVKNLDGNNLTDVMNLQDRIIASLNDDEQHFILHRTERDYMESLNGKSSHMIGVFDKDELIAQIVYKTPHNNEQRDIPEYKPNIENENLVIYEAILVDPSYRGASLMQRMLEHIEATELENQRTTALIQIAIDNPASWINALHHGMQITKVDLDPTDGVKVLYLEKNLVPTPSKPLHIQDNIKTYNMYLGDDIHKKIPPLFMKMQHLISKGYKGIGLNKETKSLVWQKAERVKTKFTLYDIMNYKKYQKTGTI